MYMPESAVKGVCGLKGGYPQFSGYVLCTYHPFVAALREDGTDA